MEMPSLWLVIEVGDQSKGGRGTCMRDFSVHGL